VRFNSASTGCYWFSTPAGFTGADLRPGKCGTLNLCELTMTGLSFASRGGPGAPAP
jgi:hypothetical protein